MTPREILEEVKRRIVAEPGAYRQTTFCGTQCCIAGHIDVVLNGLDAHVARGYNTIEAIDEISDLALSALGEESEIWLFGTVNSDEEENNPEEDQEPSWWPLDLSREYEDAETPTARTLVGCAAIDRYMTERGL